MIIDDRKYACASCIKGHRSSSCAHTDRPVFEIKKKGRPVSQCERCRELRKTNSLHTKCVCNTKDNNGKSSKKEPVSVSVSAASSAAPSPAPVPQREDVAEAKEPNFKALRAIQRATIQRAFMCSCLNGGSCVCGSNAQATPSTSTAVGSKRKQPESKPLDVNLPAVSEAEAKPVSSCCSSKPSSSGPAQHSMAALSEPEIQTAPVSSCCSSKGKPGLSSSVAAQHSVARFPESQAAPVSSCCSGKTKSAMPGFPEPEAKPMSSCCSSKKTAPSMRDAVYTPTSFPLLSDSLTPSLTSTSSAPSTSSLPDLPFDFTSTLPFPALVDSKPPPQPLPNWPTRNNAFDDWVWGDILVPDSLLPPPPPASSMSTAQDPDACTSCGNGCQCGSTCQCGHVQALQKSLLEDTSDPLDCAFAKSVLGLPPSSTIEQHSHKPVVGNQIWTAGGGDTSWPWPAMPEPPSLQYAPNASGSAWPQVGNGSAQYTPATSHPGLVPAVPSIPLQLQQTQLGVQPSFAPQYTPPDQQGAAHHTGGSSCCSNESAS